MEKIEDTSRARKREIERGYRDKYIEGRDRQYNGETKRTGPVC